eukprot:TRINITY_DN10608_c0_g1_i2.p1 TRINITY_DN10608_c0_g1~~TRINITY_DN10608_c0_g1_i2.p1  ORF type:complete len:175 (-),score=38.08 TRINITY_DN10608_c0_g1_i2:104-628(-)
MSSQGTLKSYNPSKGFGFITTSDGTDIFFHKSDLAGKPPKDGDVLTFEPSPSAKKPGSMEAKNVTGGTAGGNTQGTCKWFNEMKGYGFIDVPVEGGDSQSYFMHFSDISGGTPMEGDKLWFDIAPDEKNPAKMCAKDVVGGSGWPMGSGGGKGWGMPPPWMWGAYGGWGKGGKW